MSSNDTERQLGPQYGDATSLNHEVGRSNFNLDEVRKALEGGLNPNVQWDQVAVEGRRQTGGCVVYSFDSESSWANCNTPLHMSLKRRQFDTAALLLTHGAHINLLNALGRTALHEAISRSDSEAVKFLVDNGADLNAITEERSLQDSDTRRSGIAGILPLHEAIRAWNLQAAELLVEGGADLTRTSMGGWTILDLALLERNEPMINLLYNRGARFSESAHSSHEMPSEISRDMAQMLLADTNLFPPTTCRQVYLSIISHPEFLDAVQEYSTAPAPNCAAILDTFFSLLSVMAGKPNPENLPGAPKCMQCVRFLRELTPGKPVPFKLYLNRSSLSQSAREGCCLCAIFEDALVHKTGRWAHPDRKQQQPASSAEVILTSRFSIHGISITVNCEDQRETLEVYNLLDSFMIDLVKFTDSVELGTASPRAFRTARAWLENCRAHHSACSEEKVGSPVLPSRVIDVGNETTEPRLHVSNGERAPYLALSYCWGRSDNLETTKQSFRERMETISLASFPSTLRDAVLATRELGFRFLWIDAVCIIQDDLRDWETEAAQMQAIYANATITLSAHDSNDSQGGLYRPRQNCLTSPVQVSLRVPKKYQGARLAHRNGFYVLPVHGEKELLKPARVNTRAWTLQEQLVSARVLHWGPGALYWECLCSHGSEFDPEGDTHPYNSSCTNFMNVRHRKRVVQGRTQKGDHSYRHWPEEYEPRGNDESDDETTSPIENTVEPDLLDQNAISKEEEEEEDSDEDSDGGDIDDQNSNLGDLGDSEENDNQVDELIEIGKTTYLEWQKIVSEYSCRGLSKATDKIPAFLALSEMVGKAIQDEFVVGIWKKSYFFPSLLWAPTKPGGRSRNRNYPSWTWASVDGKISYPIDFSRMEWEPSDVVFDVQLSGPSQDHATGSITLRSTVRKFPQDFRFWRYENQLLNPFMTYTFGKSKDWETKPSKRLKEELMVVEGFRDLRAAAAESKEAGGWEGAGSEIYCVVIGRIGKQPPPRVGYPAFIGGRPKSIVCLCLVPVTQAKGAESEARCNVYRRVGLCQFWDRSSFWKTASKDECVVIV
ncbi:hypothetical protein F5X97DRAFT_301578 [Nemania serpens]|nr:hypothetical protein F5X97DRAFT_301578 [Nemania serpens]